MLNFTERISYTKNPTAQDLFRLMNEKKTNLCLAANVITKSKLLCLADTIGPEICVLKTHIDIVEDYDNDLIIKLQRLSEQHHFLLFEDRKFTDVGDTVRLQYQDGVYHIADWAHIVNANLITGPGIIDGLKQIGLYKGRGLLLVADMNNQGTLAKDDYTKKAVDMAEANTDFIIGFISTKKISDNPGLLHFTPGVRRQAGTNAIGQPYLTPENVIGELDSDIIIVGRGIYEAKDPIVEAKQYRKLGWQAYSAKLLGLKNY